MSGIRIEFRLSDAGCRADLLAGGSGERLQTIEVQHGRLEYPQAVALAVKTRDGWEVDPAHPSHGVKITEWDTTPTAAEVLADEARRRAEMAEAEKEKEAERKAEFEADTLELIAEGPEAFISTTYSRVGEITTRNREQDERCKPLIAQAREIVAARLAEKNRKDAEVEARKREQAEAEAREMAAWIDAHGSARLQRMKAEEIECAAVYRDERRDEERPGWQWYDDVPGTTDDPRNVPEEAFAILDEARQTEPAAVLQYYTVGHECDEDCCYDDCPRYDVTGYVAEAKFLGRTIVYGVPDLV